MTGRSGSLSRQSRGFDPHVEIKRGEGAQIKLCRETRFSSLVRPVCRRTFPVESRVSIPFRISRGNVGFLLKCCSRKGSNLVMTGEPRGFSRVAAGFSSYDRELRDPLVLAQGSPIFIWIVRGSWGLLSSHCRANRPHLDLCPETPCSSPVATGISVLHSRFTQGVRPHLEWKQRSRLSSLVVTDISWSLLSGLKGVKPAVESLERTQDLSVGPERTEGPHLAMTGESPGFFLSCWATCGVSLELRRGTQGASRVAPGKSSLHSSCEGDCNIPLESRQGNQASRRVEGGISRSFLNWDRKPRVPSTCDGDLRELRRVPMGSQEYCGVGRGLSGLHWVWCNGTGPHLKLR